MTLTQERLKELLDYNPETGVFTRKKTTGGIRAGSSAGCLNQNGYIHIKVDGQCYKAHRLAWLFVNGSFPHHQIDHLNCDKIDNRISNLRNATNRENCQNKMTHQEGRLQGSTFDKRKRKWMSQIQFNNKTQFLGYFLTELEAHRCYCLAHKELLGFYPAQMSPALQFQLHA